MTWYQTTLLVPIAGLILVATAGCAGGGLPLPSGQTSQIAGYWEGPVKTHCAWNLLGPTDSAASEAPASTGIAINGNGTFDFSVTALSVLLPRDRLRTAGDKVLVNPPEGPSWVEVVWSEYTPTSSRMVIHEYRDRQHASGDGGGAPNLDRPGMAGERGPVAYFGAILNKDGTLNYTWSVFSQSSSKSMIESATLHRAPSPNDRAAAAMKDYPPPLKVIQSLTTSRTIKTAAGHQFLLMTPSDKDRDIPIVVVTPLALEASLECAAKTWIYQAASQKVAIVVPSLDYQVYEHLKPTARGITEEAEKIKDCVREAKRLVSATGAYLIGDSKGAVICHMLWQKDNSMFDGFLTNDSWQFEGWVDPPSGDKTRPMFVFYREGYFGDEAKAAERWYRGRGYRVVEAVSRADADNKLRDEMVSVLLGGHPENVQVKESK